MSIDFPSADSNDPAARREQILCEMINLEKKKEALSREILEVDARKTADRRAGDLENINGTTGAVFLKKQKQQIDTEYEALRKQWISFANLDPCHRLRFASIGKFTQKIEELFMDERQKIEDLMENMENADIPEFEPEDNGEQVILRFPGVPDRS